MKVSRGSSKSYLFRRNGVIKFLQSCGVLYPHPVGPQHRAFEVRLADGTTARFETFGHVLPSNEGLPHALRRIKGDRETVRPGVIRTVDPTAERAIVEVFLEDYATMLALASENMKRGEE